MTSVRNVPGFTAEAGLMRGSLAYVGARPTIADEAAVWAQQSGRVIVGRGGESGTEAPATTCTCPCCQTVNGKLYCC